MLVIKGANIQTKAWPYPQNSRTDLEEKYFIILLEKTINMTEPNEKAAKI